MTDHFGATDRVADTLTALRADTDRLALPDSGSVRRRGEQRTRNQVVAGALAAVVLAAGAVGLMGGLGGDERRTAPPASPSPSAEATRAIAADPFLQGADLGEIGVYTLQRSPDSTEALTQKQLRCMPLPETLGAAETKGQYFYSDLEAAFKEHVLRFDTTAQATAAALRLDTAFADCPEGDPATVAVTDRGPESVRPVGSHASRTSVPQFDGEYFYYELGTAQQDNVLVVLQWTSNGNPMGNDSTEWVWTADRLQAALDLAVD